MEERGCHFTSRRRATRQVHRNLVPCPQNADRSHAGLRSREVTNRMREICTSGSVGALGGQSPRATRRWAGRVIRAAAAHHRHRLATPLQGGTIKWGAFTGAGEGMNVNMYDKRFTSE